MRRRDFITVLAGAAGYPHLAGAQKAMPVISILTSAAPRLPAPFLAAFHQELNETGYVEGQNVAIEYARAARSGAAGSYDRLPALAADLVSRKVDVILAIGGTPSALAAKNATSTIPIVVRAGADPVADGLVASLARPGGNLTGVTVLFSELMPSD
jgi:putative tryptophan/tyrosine transport system substrate-binding protein